MAKIIKNTTASPIVLATVGFEIPATSSHVIEVQEYLLWGSTAALNEFTPLITRGDIVVNDGVMDLSVGDALNFLKYPDTSFNERFLSSPERSNGFVAKTVQEAIEEAASGTVVSIAPTTTVGAVNAVAYTTVLDPNSAYKFTAELTARRTDILDASGIWELTQRVRRDLGDAQLTGHTFQSLAQRDDAQMDCYWDVSGNQIKLIVIGVDGKTIDWQPKITQVKVT
jgi:hypothetical protein